MLHICLHAGVKTAFFDTTPAGNGRELMEIQVGEIVTYDPNWQRIVVLWAHNTTFALNS